MNIHGKLFYCYAFIGVVAAFLIFLSSSPLGLFSIPWFILLETLCFSVYHLLFDYFDFDEKLRETINPIVFSLLTISLSTMLYLLITALIAYGSVVLFLLNLHALPVEWLFLLATFIASVVYFRYYHRYFVNVESITQTVYNDLFED